MTAPVLLRRDDAEADWSFDRRHYAHEGIWKIGEWVATPFWIFHHTVEGLPEHWLKRARVRDVPEDDWQPLIDRYIAAVEDTEHRERPRFARAHQAGRWTFQSVYGKAPVGINADVRVLVEALTPGAVWWWCPTTVLHSNKDKAGSVFGRVEGERILCIVAGRDPRNV
jgi:hypothetical protein